MTAKKTGSVADCHTFKHVFAAAIYPAALSRELQFALGHGVVGINVGAYTLRRRAVGRHV